MFDCYEFSAMFTYKATSEIHEHKFRQRYFRQAHGSKSVNETIGSDQCAELLRCTPEQIEELARVGDLPALKIGRSWLFVRSDLLSYLAERARAEAQERRAKRSSTIAPIIRQRRSVPVPL